MNKAKEFYEYCVSHQEVLEKLKALKTDEIAEYVKSLGFELSGEELRGFMELCAESNDKQLAELVSGGGDICEGHCGMHCENDCGREHCNVRG